MSQFWHAHWAEDSFKPTRLQNWEVPRWHPEWPTRHCETTKFEAHKNGRLFADFKRSKNPCGNFKGTWELPLKIDRKTAEKLSKSTEHKKIVWHAYEKRRELECSRKCKEKPETCSKKCAKVNAGQKENKIEKIESPGKIEEKNLKPIDKIPKRECKCATTCKI